MNYHHLYIKSLLEEIKDLNQKMINRNLEVQRERYLGGSIFSKEIDIFIKDIEEISLQIEQLNQEIVNTAKSMETK